MRNRLRLYGVLVIAAVLAVYRAKRQRYVFDGERLVREQGILAKDVDIIDVEQIVSVRQTKRNPLDRLRGTSSLTVRTSATDAPDVTFERVPDEHYRQLMRRLEAVRADD